MLLSSLLPREISTESGTETVTIVTSLLAAIHLDRRVSRKIGWRGVRPSFTHGYAWSASAAQRPDLIYGIAFTGEDAQGGLVSGRFALYAFPLPESASGRPEEQRRLAAEPGYLGRIRELSANARYLGAFACGELEIIVPTDGSAIAVTLTAQAERGLNRFSDLAPLFAVITESLRHTTGDEGELVLDADDGSAAETWAAGGFRGKLPGRRLKKLYYAHRPKEGAAENLPVIHVLTGFLGAGKTTFLRHWIEYLNGREYFTGVIQNEFGQVDLDSLVLKGQTQVEALDEGCVCCSLADSLRPGILRLIETTPAEQFILETTGVADPVNVLYELLSLNDIVERGLLITVADAWDLTRNPGLLGKAADEAGRCRMRQILNADVLVLSKADLAEEEPLERLMAELHRLNPQALVVPAFEGSIPFAVLDKFYWHWLDTQDRPLPSRQSPKSPEGPSKSLLFRKGFAAVSPAAGGATDFETTTIDFPGQASEDGIREIIRGAGAGLARAKGLVDIRDEGPSIVNFAAGLLTFEPATDEIIGKWQEASGTGDVLPPGFLVLIGHGLKDAGAAGEPETQQ